MDIAIVDDEKIFTNIMKREIVKVFPTSNIVCCHTNFLELLDRKYDICFIDVFLDDVNGIELASKYSKRYPHCKIIIVSNDERQVFKSLQKKIFFFIRKLDLVNDVKEFFDKYQEYVEDENHCIEVVDKRKKVKIITTHIIYITSAGNICFIHTIDNCCYETYSSLIKIKQMLNSENFCRINQQVIINLAHIERKQGKYITLVNQIDVKISRNYASKASKEYGCYLLRNS